MLKDDKIHQMETRVNGSDLFYWNGGLDLDKKVMILDWFESLDSISKEYVEILMSQAEMKHYDYEAGADL